VWLEQVRLDGDDAPAVVAAFQGCRRSSAVESVSCEGCRGYRAACTAMRYPQGSSYRRREARLRHGNARLPAAAANCLVRRMR
jgi:hypothetical protein